MGYHFAFLIVSLAVFGMTLGSLQVMNKDTSELDAIVKTFSRNAYWTAISITGSVVLFNALHPLLHSKNIAIEIVIIYFLFTLPFYFSGVCFCLCLSAFRDNARLYGSDLLGGAVACPLLVLGLSYLSIAFMFTFASLLAIFSALSFQPKKDKFTRFAVPIALGLLVSIAGAAEAFFEKGPAEEFVGWSALGRVKVEAMEAPAYTWTQLSSGDGPLMHQKIMWFDNHAGSPILDGRASAIQMQPLKLDISALGFALRPTGSVFVIGAGGGRDIETAFLFGKNQIDAVELNPTVVSLIKSRYADFTNYLYKKPGVNLINDEARSWLQQSQRKYDLIQSSMTGSFSSPSSGAFMLTENIVYTKESFRHYLDHLEDNGILFFLRHGDKNGPEELLRLINIAKSALIENGIKDVEKHLILVTALPTKLTDPLGALLVSKKPFEEADYKRVIEFAKAENYEIDWLPGIAAKEPFADLIRGTNKVDPGLPSDDCPFFFNTKHFGQVNSKFDFGAHSTAFTLLFAATILGVLASLIVIALPFIFDRKMDFDRGFGAVYFVSIGLGFMMVEVGLIERLTVLLGSPAYGLSVVLCALLLSSGSGSLAINYFVLQGLKPVKLIKLTTVICAVMIVLAALVSLEAVEKFAGETLPFRIFLALVLVSPVGLFLGCCLPLGLKHFSQENRKSAWFWAVNGAASVLGSILAALLSVSTGITFTLLTGAICYGIAFLIALAPPRPISL